MVKTSVLFNKTLVIGILICLLLPSAFAINNTQSNAYTNTPIIGNSNLEIINITVWEAWELLTDIGNGIQIPIDIRPDEDWNEGFIDTPYPENPVHYSKAMLETPDGLAEFIETYEDKEIILYNNQNMGYSWLMYLYILEGAGYSGTIYVWGGGLQTWIDEGFPIRNNTPPEAPNIRGPHPRGRQPIIGFTKNYKFTTIDPDGDEIYLYIDWGDGCEEGWLGPYDSDEVVTINHTYAEKDKYIVRARAKDIFDAIGPWGEEQVPIQNKQRMILFTRLIEQFPILEVLLRIMNL